MSRLRQSGATGRESLETSLYVNIILVVGCGAGGASVFIRASGAGAPVRAKPVQTRLIAKFLFSALVFPAFPSPSQAKDVLAGPVPAEVVRVVDGDTLAVRAQIWLGQTVEVDVRLAGIDAPEMKGKCPREREGAVEARTYLARLAEGRAVRLTDITRDKFGGRVIAHVASDEAPDFSAALRTRGLARAYDGHKRGSWCELSEG